MNLEFSTFQLLIDSKTSELKFINPEMMHFYKIEHDFKIADGGSVRDFKTELTDNYIWISIDFGSPSPRRETLTDINTLDEVENLRENTQAELIKQSFFLYSFKTKILYLTNSKHVNIFTKVLKEKLSIDFIIKRIYKNMDEFFSILKQINKISFSNSDDIFSCDSIERKALQDLTGTDAPEEFSIEAKYSNQMLKNIKSFIYRLFQGKKDCKLSNLVICGLDESGFQTIYNDNTFINKITINCTKNTDGLYDSDQVKNELLRKI